ncbi:MAG TPA: hypothetical protein VNZ64_05235 [Candidatus Acidoferrum sp.]|jgi:hypothetical protein|nr:hypothetical protein [Candidatus Acidoferrum sp.]
MPTVTAIPKSLLTPAPAVSKHVPSRFAATGPPSRLLGPHALAGPPVSQRLLLAAGLLLFLLSAVPLRADQAGSDENTLTVVSTSAALVWAGSTLPADHVRLREELLSEEFLSRLAPPKRSRGERQPGALFLILQTLSSNSAPTARQVLLALTKDSGFNRARDRTDALLRASAGARPAPVELVAFWDQHCQPGDGFASLTIEALVENASAPALALFEKKMLSSLFSDEDKTDWLRGSVLTHRDVAALLRSCQTLLAAGLSTNLGLALVEVLFDYKPTEWFPPDNVLHPPDRARASDEARARLREIGTWALRNLPLTASDKAAIRRTFATLKK